MCIRKVGQTSGKNILISGCAAFIRITYLLDTIVNLLVIVISKVGSQLSNSRSTIFLVNFQLYSQLSNLKPIVKFEANCQTWSQRSTIELSKANYQIHSQNSNSQSIIKFTVSQLTIKNIFVILRSVTEGAVIQTSLGFL